MQITRRALFRAFTFTLLALLLLAGLSGAAAFVGGKLFARAAAAPANHAGVVVVYGNGKTVQRCVEFSEPEITGLDLLERTGLAVTVDASNAMGAAVCKIGRDGCNYPNQNCFCQCQGARCVYWSYWHHNGTSWEYSNFGTSNSTIRDGDLDGWVWGAGTTGDAPPPPAVNFEQVCSVAEATDVPPTATGKPPTTTNIPPTETLLPKATATEIPPTETIVSSIGESDAAPTEQVEPTEADAAPTQEIEIAKETATPPQSNAPQTKQSAPTKLAPTPTRRVAQVQNTQAPTRAAFAAAAPVEPARPAMDTRLVSGIALAGGLAAGGCGALLLGAAVLFFIAPRRRG